MVLLPYTCTNDVGRGFRGLVVRVGEGLARQFEGPRRYWRVVGSLPPFFFTDPDFLSPSVRLSHLPPLGQSPIRRLPVLKWGVVPCTQVPVHRRILLLPCPYPSHCDPTADSVLIIVSDYCSTGFVSDFI